MQDPISNMEDAKVAEYSIPAFKSLHYGGNLYIPAGYNITGSKYSFYNNKHYLCISGQ